MLSHPNLKLFVLLISLLPSAAFARRGGGGGGGGGDDDDGGDDGDNLGLHLEPIVAAIFAFCVIFAIFTLFQAFGATRNLGRTTSQTSSPPAKPEQPSLGNVFPKLLCLSTWILMGTYIAQAVPSSNGSIPDGMIIRLLSSLQGILLVYGFLVLISHRRKVQFKSPGTPHNLKIAVDTILMVIVLALDMSVVGLESTRIAPFSNLDKLFERVYRVDMAGASLFLIAALDVMISSVMLYVETRRSSIDDHKLASRIAFIISPCLIILAVFPIIYHGVNPDFDSPEKRWSLAQTIIQCLTEFTIIGICLGFWVSEKKKENTGGQQSTR